jgi:hypothetical protein
MLEREEAEEECKRVRLRREGRGEEREGVVETDRGIEGNKGGVEGGAGAKKAS